MAKTVSGLRFGSPDIIKIVMTSDVSTNSQAVTEQLASAGYWVAWAQRQLGEQKYAAVIGICKERLAQSPRLVSGRLVYALALHRSGQVDQAAEQFHRVLSLDPEHLVALKGLADICFANGDEPAALTNYERILKIDPHTRGLKSDLAGRPATTTRTIILNRKSEGASPPDKSKSLTVPFFTETIGDLYLAQGYPRLAAQVFSRLLEQNESPGISEKLDQAENRINQKESR